MVQLMPWRRREVEERRGCGRFAVDAMAEAGMQTTWRAWATVVGVRATVRPCGYRDLRKGDGAQELTQARERMRTQSGNGVAMRDATRQ